MVDRLPKYRRGIGRGRTIVPKSGVLAGVAMLPHHNMALYCIEEAGRRLGLRTNGRDNYRQLIWTAVLELQLRAY